MTTPLFLSVGKTTVTVKRFGTGSYILGRWQEGTESTFTITANVQPYQSRSRSEPTAMGERSKRCIKLYSTTPLKTSQEGSALTEGDKVYWDGAWYEVIEIATYVMGVLNHTKAICQRDELV